MKWTAQDIHAAFNAANEEPGKPPLVSFLSDWEKVSEASKRLYSRMAEYLNNRMEESDKATQLHPEYCLCDECAAIRFALCGYDD